MTSLAQLKKISEKPWLYPAALLLIGFVTYLYVLSSLGYYWADWEIVMFNKLDPALQFRFYAHDRPFPWTYHLLYFLLGSKPIGWHIATLLIRWAGTLFFVQALILLWPCYKSHLLWIGALLLLYPGFLQQSQSATKSRHFMTFLLFALSIYLMALAVRRPKWSRWLFPLSWLATFTHLFTTEYFASLELLRPVLLWMLIRGDHQENRRVLRQSAINYLPYLLITIFYTWCRFIYFPIIFQTTSRISDIGSELSSFQGSFAEAFLNLFHRAFMDLSYSTLRVWVDAILSSEGFTFQSRVAWFAFGLGIVLTLVFGFFHDIDNTNAEEASGISSPAVIFIVGFVAFILAALPIWAIGKEISTGGWNDRFSLAPMLGATLMVLALLLWLVRPAGQKFVLGVLLVFSIALQAWVVNNHRRDWRTQLDYYWQLYWRAPALQPGTALFTFEQPSPSITHHADAGYVLNILYNFQSDNGSLPYWFFPRRENDIDYIPNQSITHRLRGLEFRGNTSDSIAALHPTAGACLRVLDTVYADDPLYIEDQGILIPISNLSRILPDPAPLPPDPDIFGPEPAHHWCYFFQKADLARQEKDWAMVIALHEQAQQKGLSPEYGAEYIPFIEAYAQTGDWQKAYALTRAAQRVNSGLKQMLCNNWARLRQLPEADMQVVEQARQSFACTNY
jgi:hypothetical protein